MSTPTRAWHGVLVATALPLRPSDAGALAVQAIKLSMDVVGRYGGPCRPPRVPLTPEQEQVVRQATEKAVAEGLT
jgi:1-pyrroline-4-hydroxy-2-carboxylate deaminase